MLVIATAEAVTAVTVGGAIVVALITAMTTNRRQREALRHGRELADLDDLRALLDEAAVAMRRSRDKFDNLVKRFEEHGKDLPDAPREELAEAGRTMLALDARLIVRLGEEGPVTRPFEAACAEMLDTWHEVVDMELEEASEEKVADKIAEVKRSKVAFDEAWEAFAVAAVARAGTAEARGALQRSSWLSELVGWARI
jgi:hypothetical protein